MFWGDFRLSHCYSVSPFISGLCPTIIMEEDEWAPEVRSHQHEHLATLRWKENSQTCSTGQIKKSAVFCTANGWR